MHDFLFFHTQKVLSLSLLVFGVFFNFELLYSLQFYFELIWISFVFSAVIFLILIWLQSFHCKEDMHFWLLVQNRIGNSFHHCHKQVDPKLLHLETTAYYVLLNTSFHLRLPIECNHRYSQHGITWQFFCWYCHVIFLV